MLKANTNHKLPAPQTLMLPWYSYDGYKQKTIMTLDGTTVSTRVAVSAVMRFYYRSLGIAITKAEARDLVDRGYHGYIKRREDLIDATST